MSTFICYRRSDSEDITGRTFDRLVHDFGPDHVFKDVDSIPLGADFTVFIAEALKQCQVLIAVIGKDWLNAVDETGNRRLDNPEDWVRLEIATALKAKIRVVPLLVNGAEMPKAVELPRGLKKLARCNAAYARSDPDFHKDIDRLIRHIKPVKSQKDSKTATCSPKSVDSAESLSLSSRSRKSNRLKASKPRNFRAQTPAKKTVKYNKTGVSELPVDKPVVYKILTEGKRLNYVGFAKKGDVQAAILKHLIDGKFYVPGHKVQIVRTNKIRTAQKKAEELILEKSPPYNL